MIKIQIADRTAYERGYFYFEWVELPTDWIIIDTAVKKVLKVGTELCRDKELHTEVFIAECKCREDLSYEVLNELLNV